MNCVKLSLLYIYIYAFVYVYLFRNVITYSLCIVCVWILWWFWTLCLWEHMIEWMTLKNFMLDKTRTQWCDGMWNWNMSLYIICIISWTCYFMLFCCLTCFLFGKIKWTTFFWTSDTFNLMINVKVWNVIKSLRQVMLCNEW